MRSSRIGLVLLALVCALATGCAGKASQSKLAEWSRDLERLRAEQDSLRVRAAILVQQDVRIQTLPQGDVVIGVPTDFLESVITRLLTDVASQVTLELSGIRAHVQKSVKKIVKVGDFKVDVEILRVTGHLEPQTPTIEFGGNNVSLSLPVRLTDGQGEAEIHFVWDGKHVADLTCGDMDVTQVVSGDVIPATYVVSGAMRVSVEGNHIIGTPVIPETRIRLRVKPSKESWDAVNALLAEKHGVCGWVLDKVDVPKLLTGVVEEKGFNIKLPVDKLRPFRVPAGVRDSIDVRGERIALDVRTNLLRIDPDMIWYSADVTISEATVAESVGRPDGRSAGD